MRSSGVFERIIAGCNDVQVMLDDNHRIAQFDQPIELSHQSLNVRWMQPGGRFIQNIQRASALVALQFCREFYTLRFAARQFSCGLPQPQVSQTDLLQNHEGMSYLRCSAKNWLALSTVIARTSAMFCRNVLFPVSSRCSVLRGKSGRVRLRSA